MQTFWQTVLHVAEIVGAIMGIVGFACFLIKPLREKILGTKAIRDGQLCMLRRNMLGAYHKHMETKELRQYELEAFILEYKAYKALGGNSFIDLIYEEVKEWTVTS